jgi:hypothetical protein
MSTRTSSPIDRSQSRLAERVQTGTPGTQPPLNNQEVSIARVVSEDDRARSWRVTFLRLERSDAKAPLHSGDAGNSSPAWISQLYQYAAGDQNTPAVPPRRSEPVLGFNGSADVEPVFAQISWGMQTAQASRLIANWPAQGASLVVVGSYVEVFGAYAVFNPGSGVAGEWPVFAATIVPADGLSVEDSGDLSLQQLVGVPPFTAAVFGTLSTDGDIHAGQLTPPPPVGAIAPVVLDTAGLPAWQAVLTAISVSVSTFSLMVIDTAQPVVNEVRDNQWFNPTTLLWQPSVGNVGAVINLGDASLTVAQLEALINATSTLAQVTTPDAAHAAETFVVTDLSQIGSFSASAAGEEGGAVYVPDFARRVRVVLVTADANYPGANNFRVPLTGDPPCQLVWYDDRGDVVDASIQNTSGGGGVNSPPVWHAVPARAVMLGIYSQTGTAEVPLQALVHWRIAP